MSKIHPTAIVSPRAELADDVEVGPFTIIEDDVVIGKGSTIASSVVLASGARLGENVSIFSGAVVGTVPQDLKFKGEKTVANIGDKTTIREYATVNRGTAESGHTSVGKNCLLMAYSHCGHDCHLGDHVIMGNCATLAGHVEIHDYAILSGVLPVHQFVKIGAHSIIGGGFRVPQDVCPYALAAGYPLKVAGGNKIGLQRRGFKPEVINAIKQAFKLLFFSGLNTTQAVEAIKSDIETIHEIQTILDFIAASNRGLMK